MRRFAVSITVAAATAAMLASASAFGAKGGIPGPPSGGGGGETPDLGDIIILYRDAWGLPYLTDEQCQQPLPSEPVDPLVCPPECVVPGIPAGASVVQVDPGTCGVALGCELCTEEVDFGRTSVMRSPASVLEASLQEAVSKLATAQCITLDPAGRLVTTSEIDGEVVSAAIDSPLENLAIYRQLLLTGYIGAAENPIVLPDPDVLDMAARGLGAAADKTGKVTLDQVVYSNQILGLVDEDVQTYLPKKCLNVREEVEGNVQTVRKCFLNYGPEDPDDPDDGDGGADFQYSRAASFNALPAPAYIPADDPQEGWFEYLGLWAAADGTIPDLFYRVQGPIMDDVFGGDPGFLDGNVGGFAQAADDTREVIEFTHDRPLPLGYETAVPLCVNPAPYVFDVSISPDSGLQVPVRMVVGTEGREVILTVANAGPDAATGTATVTGVATDGTQVFSRSVGFALDEGLTQSWTWTFTLDFATTVTWTAVAAPDCVTCDLNTANNSVVETTTVRAGGGGRR